MESGNSPTPALTSSQQLHNYKCMPTPTAIPSSVIADLANFKGTQRFFTTRQRPPPPRTALDAWHSRTAHPGSLAGHLCPPLADIPPLPLCPASGTKIRLAPQAPKYVANIVGGRDALLKSAVPLVDNPSHNRRPSSKYILLGNIKAILVEDDEMLVRAHPRRRPVKVGSCEAHQWPFPTSPPPPQGQHLPVLMRMTLPKSTNSATAIRTSTSSTALSSWAVMQYFPVPLVHSVVTFSNASLSSVPE